MLDASEPRCLTTEITWDVPYDSGLNDPANVSFSYDNAGNRTDMTDGLGSVEYNYNSLSQITSELRDFTDTLDDAPIANGKFELAYTYHIGGQLKTLTDPYGDSVSYEFDITGRLSELGGSSFGGQTEYIVGAEYRAWGAPKVVEYGNGLEAAQTFNDALQPSTYSLTGAINATMQKNYEYYNDGKLKYTEDELNPIFDRFQSYDHQGRTKDAKTGLEARGGTVTTGLGTNLPYRQSYDFDAFGNMTTRNNLHWGESSHAGRSFNLSYTYENNRTTNTSWNYDADGRNTQSFAPDAEATSGYDAAGRMWSHHNVDADAETRSYFDGDGREIKSSVEDMADPGTSFKYYIRSSVLGGEVVSETWDWGRKRKTFVRAGEVVIAVQGQPDASPYTEGVNFKNWDGSGMSFRYTFSEAAATYDGSGLSSELDAARSNVGYTKPFPPSGTVNFDRDIALAQPRGSDGILYYGGVPQRCYENGAETPCFAVRLSLRLGASKFAGSPMDAFMFGMHGYWRSFDNGSGQISEYHFYENTGEEFVSLERARRGMNDCEKYLAKLFTRQTDVTFSDVTDDDPIDTLTGLDENPENAIANPNVGFAQTHNHGYNPVSDPTRATSIYAPTGGRVIGSGYDSGGQSYVNVFYRNLGGESNIVLQFFHSFHKGKFNGGTQQADGSILIGTMGTNGSWSNGYGKSSDGKYVQGFHYHINAWKWWGSFGKKGNPIGGGSHPPYKFRSMKNVFRLSKLCPKGVY